MRVAFGPFTFDAASRELAQAGRRLHLSPKAFDVLHVLLERRPAVVTKAELHERVWSGAFVVDANLSVAIAEIRQALGGSKDGQFIRTVHRVGYAFCAQATAVGADAPGDRGLPFSRCWLRCCRCACSRRESRRIWPPSPDRSRKLRPTWAS